MSIQELRELKEVAQQFIDMIEKYMPGDDFSEDDEDED